MAPILFYFLNFASFSAL